MYKTRSCPKCRSQKIMTLPGWTGSHGSGQYLRMYGFHLLSANIKFNRYVCENCGYIEEWVADPKELETLKKKMGSKEGI